MTKTIDNLQMKISPIIFSTPMVQAILEGRKTMTRRVVKWQPIKLSETIGARNYDKNDFRWPLKSPGVSIVSNKKEAPADWIRENAVYGEPGDILWVRETFAEWEYGGYAYKADGFIERYGAWERDTPNKLHDVERIEKWTPAIFMPKEAARLFLKITDVRVERLQEITEFDAIDEGVESMETPFNTVYKHYLKDKYGPSPIHSYQTLWEKINGPGSWEANPWVWVISFERVEKPNQTP